MENTELKRRYANRHKVKKPDSNLIYLLKSFDDDNFKGDVSYYNFKDADIKIVTPKGKSIVDNNYKLLGFYDYNSKIKLSAFYNDNNELIEWYFDVAKNIGFENGSPYEDDLYLDVILRPNGKILLLDEDELKSALEESKITKEDFDLAYFEANKLMKLLDGKENKLKDFTDKFLNYFLSLENL